MRVSKINMLKDLAGGIILILMILLIVFAVIPVIGSSQLAKLKETYISEQKTVIAQTVENTAAGVLKLSNALISSGMSAPASQRTVLEQLANERYGTDGFGYYFALDLKGTVIMHPFMKELIGRNLSDIVSPDGVNLGALFRPNLESGRSGFVRYSWTVPGKGVVSRKSAYAA